MDIGKYFASKKQELSSNNSADGDIPKKVKETNVSASSDVSISNDDVFAGSLDDPNCKDILFNTLKNLDLRVKEIFNLAKQNQENHIKGKGQLTEITDGIKYINDQFTKYEEERKERDQEVKHLKEEISKMSNEMKDLKKEVDRQEQYSRRNCLLVHGVKEEQNEDTDKVVIKLIRDNLEEDISLEDLDRTHRIGSSRNSNGKTRPIIIKFARYNVRRRVFSNKKKLKGKPASITESLTKFRVEKLQEAREAYGRENVWRYDGRILFKEDGKIKYFYD